MTIDNKEGGACAPSFPCGRPSIEALLNVPMEELLDNIRINSLRKLHWLWNHEAKDVPALIVGSGPSLADDVQEIKARKAAGAVIIGLNGAVAYLAERGIEVDWQLMLDVRPSNVKFMVPFLAKRLLIASQCNPVLFDAVGPERTVLFHAHLPKIESALPPKTKYVSFAGGFTSGLTALCVVSCGMGFRELHLYGYDSSDRDDKSHPFEQVENSAEQARLEVVCAGRTFRCSFAMYKQAESFRMWADAVEAEGVKIVMHGDGLLPTLVREQERLPEVDAAVYDFNKAPASWDFLPWLVNATMAARQRGVDRLRVCFLPGPNCGFRNDGLPLDIEERNGMLDGVMRPALDLFGAVEDPSIKVGHGHDYMLAPVCENARNGIPVPTIEPPPWAFAEVDRQLKGKRPVVITLREASHWPARNSNVDAWFDFAEDLLNDGEQVIILRDTQYATNRIRGFETFPRASLDIKVRAALYERAKANLFVANGPIALAYFGTRPFLIFKPVVEWLGAASSEWWSERVGIAKGGQYPWCRADQRIVWQDDNYENITRAWAGLLPLLAKRAYAA